MKRILFAVLLIVAVFVAVFVFLPAAPVSARCDITSSKCTSGPHMDGLQPTVPPPANCIGSMCKPVSTPGSEGVKPVTKHQRPPCSAGPQWCTPEPLPFDMAQ